MLGDTDPVIAVQECRKRQFDEGLRCDAARRHSRWLASICRTAFSSKMTDAVVHHVEATEAHQVAPLRVG